MKKILLSDYDQTFYVSKNDILKNIDAIKRLQDNGDCFAIVTGRKFDSIKRETEKYNIPYNYLSCVDGATLFDENDYLIKHYLMNEDICEDMKYMLDRKTDIKMTIYREENAFDKNNNVIQCYYDVTNYGNVDYLYQTIREVTDYYNMNVEVLEFDKEKLIVINSGLTNKAVAGRDIADLEEIPYDNVFAIGDHCNDIEMIREFNGYAISNAIDDLKGISCGIYDSVSDLAEDIITRKLVRK